MRHLKISLQRRRRRSLDSPRETGTGAKNAAPPDRGYAISWPQFQFVERR